MICSNCSQPVSGGVKFCPECGYRVATAVAEPPPIIDSEVERISREAATRAANAEASAHNSATSNLKVTNRVKPSVKKKGVMPLILGAFIGVLIVCLGAIALLVYDANVSASRNGSKPGSSASIFATVAKPKERTVDPNGIYFRCIGIHPAIPGMVQNQVPGEDVGRYEIDFYVISAQKDNFDYFSKFLRFSKGSIRPDGEGWWSSQTINRTTDWDNVYTIDPTVDDADSFHLDSNLAVQPDFHPGDPKHSWYHFDTAYGALTPQESRQWKWASKGGAVMIDKDRLVIDTSASDYLTSPLPCTVMSRTDAQQVVDKYWDVLDHQPPQPVSVPAPF